MMLSYQPIRSLATINMIAYEGAAAFKRITSIIDTPIKIKDEKQSQILSLKIVILFLKMLDLDIVQIKFLLLKI